MTIRRLWLLPIGFALALLVPCPDATHAQAPDRDYVVTATVHRHDAFDFGGIRYYELAIGNDTHGKLPPIVWAVEEESEAAAWLDRHAGQRVAVSLRSGGLLTRDGER